jgi:hypothetical protein
MDEVTLRDILDSIEGCERLIQYYKIKADQIANRPVNMGSDPYELEMTDDEKYRIDDLQECRKKIQELEETRLRLMESIENNHTFRRATGSLQNKFAKLI